MTVSIQQQNLIIAAARGSIKYKPLLLLSAVISAITLSACQTAPNAASGRTGSITSTSTTAVIQAPATIEDTYADDYSIEPSQTITSPPYTITSPPYTIQSAPPINDNTASRNPLTQQPSTQTHTTTQQLPDILSNNSATTVTPLPEVAIDEAITRDDYMISQPSHNELLERARQNSQQQTRRTSSDKSNLPAFRNLMQTGTKQLKTGKLTEAESSFTRAQRLAPRSSAVYFYLSQVALKKNQPRKAEAMARRGLSVSQETSRRRALWQLILQSGQLQNNPRVIREAQQALR
ncbi:tetratricopeptide repeat protein [Psychrobacter sp. CAL346-MNA-CIBAN-0220]|uniref:tetratricopeptide repeat protein n=1 Tax=Psychrobacter sp. CAL346-MNA-CIBAN-0220 TaxID=3140457 RepID=UPI003326E130